VPFGAGFDADATLDCNNAQTLGHFDSYIVSAPASRCFTTDEPTPVTVSITGDSGRVSLLGYDCHPDDRHDPDLRTGFTFTVTGDMESTLARCTWLIDFVADWSEQPQAFEVSVVPR